MTAGFEIALIRSLWNIDYDASDPKLSSAIAMVYEPLLIKSNREDLADVLEQMFSSENVEVAHETQERTSNKTKKPITH